VATEKIRVKPVPEGNRAAGARPEYLIGASLALGAMMICLAVYMGAGNITQGVGALENMESTGAPPPQPSVQQQPDNQDINQSTIEVTVDFLYADWCPHCQNMKPIVAKMIAEFPSDRFEVRYWSEDDGKSKPAASAIYKKYSQEGVFTGYPTFVVNGGKDYRAGEMAEQNFRAWLCYQFSEPKPSNC
jgi:thiol-disulfide isomerase/thioredoxin